MEFDVRQIRYVFDNNDGTHTIGVENMLADREGKYKVVNHKVKNSTAAMIAKQVAEFNKPAAEKVENESQTKRS